MGVSPFISSPVTDSTVNRWIASWTQGKGRILNKEITERGIKVHKSVWIRINAQPMKGTVDPYTPKIRFTFKDGPRHLTRVEWLKAEWWTSPDPKLITWVD